MALHTPAAGAGATDSGVFARKATGLVREVSPLSAFVFNCIGCSPPLVLAVSVFWMLGVFPGASLYGAYWLVFGVAAIFALAFGVFSAAMPRSGGDYILVSRSLSPVFGLMSNFNMLVSQFLSAAFICLSAATVAVGPSLTVLGLVEHSPSLVHAGNVVETTKGWQFGIGLATLLIAVLAISAGWKWGLRFQNGLFIFAGLGLAAALVTLLATSPSGFIHNFNSFANPYTHKTDTYHSLITTAQHQGINTHPGSSLANTWPAMGAIMSFSIFTWWSINIAGEVRRARTWRITGTMVGAAFFGAVTLTVFTLVFFHTFGGSFFTAANALNGTSAYPFAAPPFYVFLTAVAGGSTFLAWFLSLSFVAIFPLVTFFVLFQPIRAFFAYGFDGIAPLNVAYVTRRSHVPIVAVAISTLATAGVLAWAVWTTSFFTFLAYTILFNMVPMVFMAIAMVLLPYLRPELWKATLTPRRVVGVPIVSLLGAAALACLGFAYYLFYHYTGLGIAADKRWAVTRDILIVSLAGAVYYYAASAIKARKGVRLANVYREIPPE
jgi:basic amino acid/polyamine antiporter, APA family